MQPLVIEGRAELLPRDQPTVAVRKSPRPATSRDEGSVVARPRRRARPTQTSCSSAASPPGCCGATSIRSAGAHAAARVEDERLKRSDRHRRRRQAGRALGAGDAPTVYEYTRERSGTALRSCSARRCRPRRSVRAGAGVVQALDPRATGRRRAHDGRRARPDADARSASARCCSGCSPASRWRSRQSGSTACSRISSAAARAEIGIRTALGAQTGRRRRLVVVEGMTPALIGIAVGAAWRRSDPRSCSRRWCSASARADPLTLAAVGGTLRGRRAARQPDPGVSRVAASIR